MSDLSDVDLQRYQTDLVAAGLARRHARRWSHRDREAIVAGDVRLTWQQLDDRVKRLADALSARGIGHGDTVALFMRNRSEFFEIVLALASLGAAAAPQSFRSSVHELVYAMDATDARLLIAETGGGLGERAVAALAEVKRSIDMLSIGDPPAPADAHDPTTYEHLLATGRPVDQTTSVSEDDAFWLALTGGTTGLPKLVRVPHRVIVQMWLYMVIEFEITRSDTMLICGPLHHGLGFGFALQQLYVGGRVVVLPEFDARTVLSVIERERITVMPAAPAMLKMMLAEYDRQPADLSSLRNIVSAGSPLMTATKEQLMVAAPAAALYEHYGATEAGFFTVLRPEDQLRKNRSCGYEFFGSEIKVMDDDGHDVGPGDIGLVYKRGLIEGGGYLGNVAATDEMFHDGWCTVGDLGFMDDEGYLHLVDRKKDLIVSGGVNIYPAEIEEAIVSALPGVSEAAVVGVPDERWGETVKAFVVLRPGADVVADDVVAACTARLASYKQPRLVQFVDDLPRSAAGKVLKRELRNAAWSGHERSVG